MRPIITQTTTTDTAAGTNTDISGARIPVAAGYRYWFRVAFMWNITDVNDGAQFIVDVPGSPTKLGFRALHATTASSVTSLLSATDGGEVSATTSAVANGNITVIEGYVKPSAVGEIVFQVDCEGAGDVTVEPALIQVHDMGTV